MATTIADVGTELVERAHGLARDAARHGGDASGRLAHAAAELAERATDAGSELAERAGDLADRAGDGARRVGELLPDHAPAVRRPRRAWVGLALGAVVVTVVVVAWRRGRRPDADAAPDFERPAAPGPSEAARASA